MDEVFRSNIVYQDHSDELFHEVTQPSEDLILERNKELRKNPGVIRDLGAQGPGGTWGRSVAVIPFITLEWAKRNGYELDSGDAEHRSKELFRFLRSEKGKECLITDGAIK